MTHFVPVEAVMAVRLIRIFVCCRFASFKKWKFEEISVSKSEAGGFKVYVIARIWLQQAWQPI